MDEVSKDMLVQEDRLDQILKAITNYQKSPRTRITLTYLDTRLEMLESTWKLFQTTHAQIIGLVTKEQRTTHRYFNETIFQKYEDEYINYKCMLKTKMKELTPIQETQTTSFDATTKTNTSNAEIKLPTINIPTFSGKYTDWPSFHDLFDSIIHTNNALDDVQKLHYLKSSLTGEAEQLLSTVTITSNNYKQAWDTLIKRYNNKRFISNCIFKRLFGIKPMMTESSQNIKQLLDTTTECISLLKNLNLPTDSWDAIVVYLTVSKLDNESHKQWEQGISEESDELPSFERLKQYLAARFRSLEMIGEIKHHKLKTFHNSVNQIRCAFCKGEHHIYSCKTFSKKDYKGRYEFVQTNGLCFNCLIPKHSVAKCMKPTCCRICGKRHHSLLHPEGKGTGEESSSQSEGQQNHQHIVSHFIHQPGQVLLATALVDVASRNKHTHTFRAFIDQGSQASFVTERLVQSVGLKRVRVNGRVSGLGEENNLRTKYMVEVEIRSIYKPHLTFSVKAYVLSTLTKYLPTEPITMSNWPELKKMTLADPGYDTPNKIDLLLGAEVYSKIIDIGVVKSPTGILAQETHLGWILSGDTSNTDTKKNKQIISMHVCMCENEQLKRFWEIENDINTERTLTMEDERCEKIYKATTTRTETGRYKVCLPFKHDAESPAKQCGNTKEIAISRFLQLERKFKQNPNLKKEYTRVINEYLELGHMVLADESIENTVYLPHHAIIRNDKETTKVRMVVDASAKGSTGCSLNDTMLTGPVLQRDLRSLIMEWRKQKIVVVSDIVKMFRQILVADEHTELQRIVWREDPEEPLKSYKFLTVTFGTAAAPYLAVRTLLQLAEDEGHKFPIAAELVKTSFYMDDLMTGCRDIDEAMEIYKQMNELLKSGGFILQKWSSNSNEFLERISQVKENTNHSFEIKFDKMIKILGLLWDRSDDKFKFSVNLPQITNLITKRGVLSDVAKLFDPFGWLAPSIIIGKIFIQRLWLCSADWDDELPQPLQDEWLRYRSQLVELEKIELDRWLHTYPNNANVELHGFSDASTVGYAAVLYLRVVQDNNVNVTILVSKTKVAPLKQISVARLELCGAVLLAKLISEVANQLRITKERVYAYTDSMVVLAWIQAQPMRWQTFVGNRVSEIQKRLDNDRWRHVGSKDNPADLASRGIKPSELVESQLWWRGPSWLSDTNIIINRKPVPATELESKPNRMVTFCNQIEVKPIWERFSSLNRMIRVLTYCRRFLRLKLKGEIRREDTKYLNTEELQRTLDTCIKRDQELEFFEEITDLKAKSRVKKRSKLLKLSPYLDEKGVLRVGGRLKNTALPQEMKYPIILSRKSHLTALLIQDSHVKLLHGGSQQMINYLRTRYWILGIVPLVKRCVRQCVTCVKHKAITTQPYMGDLPCVRVNPGRPFKASGVDFAGPIQMRTSKGRGHKSFKGYICLFICMKTKAIHLEAVSDLTAQGFIAAFKRFVSRRGHCSDLYSDNGLNFVGAARVLKQEFIQAMTGLTQEVAELMANDGTAWHFIPPRAPNFGGLWEAGIKSVKSHLYKIIGNMTLTFEEMSTLLTQIEACLNSRPICQLNDNPDDLAPLTPAHFLVGEPLISVPERRYDDTRVSALERWRLIQTLLQHFWKRWSREYLHTLQERNKWQTRSIQPHAGDVVIVKDEDTPPAKWLMARVSEVHPGPDNEIRVVTVRCKTSYLKRPLSKLIRLPTNSDY